MNKLNSFGIGPKIGGITLPWGALAVYFSLKYKTTFMYFEDRHRILFFTGLALLMSGALLYIFTIPSLLKGLKQTRLITGGTYYLCCNPLYSSVILLIIPGVSLMMNSWLVLTASVVGFAILKMLIKKEYQEMEKFFGEEYKKYKAETPDFLPFPFKKWTRGGLKSV